MLVQRARFPFRFETDHEVGSHSVLVFCEEAALRNRPESASEHDRKHNDDEWWLIVRRDKL